MNINSTHSILASIAAEVAKHGDKAHVFAAINAVLSEYRKVQGQDLALAMYMASAKKDVAILARAFAKMGKRRDAVLAAINTAYAVHGYDKNAIADLAVYTAKMATGIAGSHVYQGVDSFAELTAVLRHDDGLLSMLQAWGKSLAHEKSAANAAQFVDAELLGIYKHNLLAIGKAMAAKGNTKDLVPFFDGVTVSWAAAAYEALAEGGKPSAVINGLKAIIAAAINAAFYKERSISHPLAGVIEGRNTAYRTLFPSGNTKKVDVRVDSPAAAENAYAGGDDVLVLVGERILNLGYAPSAGDLEEAIASHKQEVQAVADRLLAKAAVIFHALGMEVKEGGVEYTTFEALKDAIYAGCEARSKAKAEAKAEAKALQQAMLAVQAASKMDAASRSQFLAAVKDLPLAKAKEALAIKAKAVLAAANEGDVLIAAHRLNGPAKGVRA